ncbi:MAG TPA: LptA/OstA family protein [Myxococcales bacterium]|jgi:lipopolysaccharide transport protein LptA|nr:LptA/OstA family protein [Myxococcales bacterium]
MIAFVATALVAAPAVGQGPLDFTAQTMRMEPRGGRTLLDGSVRLSRGGMVVTGDRAVVEFVSEQVARPAQRKPRRGQSALLGQKIDRFTVDGNVHVQRGNRTADGGHGVFDAQAQTLVLTAGDAKEDPVLRDGSETLSGDRIVMRLDTEDVDVQKPRVVLRRAVPEAQDAPDLPTRVEAVRLSVDRSERLARFTDDVVVRRGDVVVRGPRMDARYDDSGQLTTLYLRGGVEMRQGDRRALAQNADYDARTRELILTGEPQLFDRGDVLVGDRIAMALDSHEVRVERAHGRLRPEVHEGETRPGARR